MVASSTPLYILGGWVHPRGLVMCQILHPKIIYLPMAYHSASGGTNDPAGHILGVLFDGIQGLGDWKRWKNVERSGGKIAITITGERKSKIQGVKEITN